MDRGRRGTDGKGWVDLIAKWLIGCRGPSLRSGKLRPCSGRDDKTFEWEYFGRARLRSEQAGCRSLRPGSGAVACFGVQHGFGVDAGMEIWAESKASVCKGIWGREIGTRPAIKGRVRTLQALRSDACEPIALRSLEVPPRKHLIPVRQKPHRRRKSTLNDLPRPSLPRIC
jgi:hypothetical protein